MTISEVRKEYERLQALDKPFFAPKDVCSILGVTNYSINLTAYDNPALLGYPVMMSGKRVRIPKASFLDFIARNVLGDPEPSMEQPETT